MTRTFQESNRAAASDLHRVIEPLTSYICATDRPEAVLNLVFSVIANEVAQVNRAARIQAAAFRRPATRIMP